MLYTNAVDGINGMLWNDSEEDGDIKSVYEDDEHTVCENGDSDTDGQR